MEKIKQSSKTLHQLPLYRIIGTGLLTLASISALAETGNPRVNQLGYLPNGEKTATYKASSTSPQTWQLKQNGTVVASGQTSAASSDAASGDTLQQIDLSNVSATGTGFTLTVGSDTSYPFAISSTALKGALYDSLKYFYHNRSGITIDTAYTGGGNGSYAASSKWSRPAGHLNLGANKGDMNVPCWSGTCNYSLNVTKGWYDAGDHGKYVVNGGISAWTLLNLYERNQYLSSNASLLGDGKLNIPESTNGVPDLLDEARWEVEFLLSMQVPTGQTKAGMVHHKMHDVGWTGFPMAPHEDPQQRALVPPTTAATLNLAAVAAQSARIWKDLDAGFSATCLTAAKRAWDAAQANPNDLYSGNYDNGGGGYGDKSVSDEFYWAAVELYLTTGDSKYLPTITAYTITKTDFGWADTELAGLISLAVVPNSQTTSMRSAAQQKIASIANTHLNTQNASGYPAPMSTLEYYWGSNGGVANKLMLLGLAYDFTKDDSYAKGVGKGLDYLLGRNALSISFVTGEGAKAVTQPHHRFWSNAISASYPSAPPGALSGGPNSGLDDTTAAGQLGACKSKPATCWIDNINAYSVNEIAINWNAPLAWDLAFYNDYALGGNSNNSSSSSTSSSKPSSSSVATTSSSKPSSSSIASTSSSVKSSTPSSSSSSSSVASGQQCNWYGTLTPLCVTTTSGWGYESGKSCVAYSTCAAQPAPYGVVGGSSSSSSSSAVNHAPTAVITGGSRFSPCCSINLSATSSTDPDNDTLSYTWAVTNCGSFSNNCAPGANPAISVGPTLSIQTRADASYTVVLTVDDGRGGSNSKTQNYSYIVETSSAPSSSSSSSRSSVSSSSIPSTSSSSSSSVRSSSSSSSSVVSASKCTYVIASEWNTGFTGAIRIINTGTSAINGWTVGWSYSDGTRITNSWNATVTGSNPYSATNLSWNSSIQPGQTVEIGVQGNKGTSSSAQIPVVSGSVCN